MSTFDQPENQALPGKHLTVRVSLLFTAREAFGLAIEALRTHKLRAFLTLLGVVISTTTLIVVMSVVNGMNLYIADHIANLGANTFILHQFQWAQGYDSWLRARRRNKPIRIEDYTFLRDNLKGYRNIGAEAQMRPPDVRYSGQIIYDVDLTGVTPSMLDIGQAKVDLGRYFNDTDYSHNSMVCFIGHDLVTRFFPNVDPLGKEILVAGIPFRVIGTAQVIGTTFGQSQDQFVQIPLSSFQKTFVRRPQLAVSIQAYNADGMMELEDEVTALMRARRHVPFHEENTFGINASETIMSAWKQLTGTIFAVTIGVVAVFMVIGGIVIMNIMLASVTERTHEIGIRKSLGARRRDILLQFIIESGVMAVSGGAVGVLLSVIISAIVNIFFTASTPLMAVFAGLALSLSVGLFFGIYPASKAAKLDPIEALRTEA